MEKLAFRDRRRQAYLDEESYRNTIAKFEAEDSVEPRPGLSPVDTCTNLELAADVAWDMFQLKYTAGESLTDLASSLDDIVLAFERLVDAQAELEDDDYYPPFVMDLLIDTYVDYLNLVSVAILLRREDLVARICALIEGTAYDQADAIIEELFKFFLPDRLELNFLLWANHHSALLDAIDSETPAEMATEMQRYVKNWYLSMKGKAAFWGQHENIKPEFTPYTGYWAMYAAAFTYLYDMDDSSYRNELAYPKHLADYARSLPRNDHPHDATTRPLRVEGGAACSRAGLWLTAANADGQARFAEGDSLPDYPTAAYGLTIWQWMGD